MSFLDCPPKRGLVSRVLQPASPMPLSPIRSEPNPQILPLPSSSLRQRLRAATAKDHERLDVRFGAFDLTRLPDYRRFLEASAAALLPLEAKLERSGVARLFPDWPARSRACAITNDLANVAGSVLVVPEPDALDLGGILGTMYVLEGSRLGAQVLLRRIMCSPDPLVAGTTAYLRHGTSQRLWQSFLEVLETQGAALDDDSGAIAAAHRAFAVFDRAVASA